MTAQHGPGLVERFTDADMVGYGHAAYCAGWSAPLKVIQRPNAIIDHHGYDWLRANLPEANGEPLWRGLPPISTAARITALEAINGALVEALRNCRRAVSSGRSEPRRSVREIVDTAIEGTARAAISRALSPREGG